VVVVWQSPCLVYSNIESVEYNSAVEMIGNLKVKVRAGREEPGRRIRT
jgi:hypothetical protein